jgi:hypothetical protein
MCKLLAAATLAAALAAHAQTRDCFRQHRRLPRWSLRIAFLSVPAPDPPLLERQGPSDGRVRNWTAFGGLPVPVSFNQRPAAALVVQADTAKQVPIAGVRAEVINSQIRLQTPGEVQRFLQIGFLQELEGGVFFTKRCV